MFDFLRKLRLNAKLLLFCGVVLLVIFIALALGIYTNSKNQLIQASDSRMYSQLEDLTNLLEIEYRYKQEAVDKALRVANQLFYGMGEVIETAEQTQVVLINPATNRKKIVEVPRWNLNDRAVQSDTSLVNRIKRFTGTEAAVFQKVPDGYVRITTTETDAQGKDLIGVYLPNSSQIVQTIEKKQTFRSRVYQNKDWYITAFEPILIDGQIRGILYTGIKEKDIGYLRKKFKEKKYYTTGYPFAMTMQGQYLIHPIQENNFNRDKRFLDYVRQNKRGKYRFRSFEGANKASWKWYYFTYYEPFDMIVAATIDETELIDKPLNALRNTILWGCAIALVVCLLGIALIVSNVTRFLNNVVEVLGQLAKGRKVQKLKVKTQDEIGQMAESVNMLITGFDNYADFAYKIGHGNLNTSFNMLSEEDALGSALIEMRDSLRQVAQEDKKRAWMTQGLTMFNEILQRNSDDIEKLSYEVIASLVKYLEANQGGVFLAVDIDPEDVHLEMVACYAYDRQKMMKKKIRVGEGLVGQSFQEADTLQISEIPQEYIKITSGLGEANPTHVLIVPLRANEVTYGVVELASFESFKENEVEFVEKLSESLAITLSSVRNNLQTRKLLEESRLLTQQMRQQEEEMRQNMEELEATQEEMNRNDKETKRLLAEANLQNKSLEDAFNHTEDLIVSVDKDFKLTLFNQAARQWYQQHNGVKLSIGSNLLAALSFEQSSFYKENFSRALLGERFSMEEQLEEEYYLHDYYPFEDEKGKPAGVVIFTRNITALKRTEVSQQEQVQQLQEQLAQVNQSFEQTIKQQKELSQTAENFQAELKALQENQVMQLHLHLDGQVQGANKAFCDIFQYDPQELVGKNYKILVDSQEAESANYINFWRNLRVGTSVTGEQKRMDKYGQQIWIWSSYGFTKDAQGKVTSIIEMSVDITAYKLQERVYLQKIAQLEAKK